MFKNLRKIISLLKLIVFLTILLLIMSFCTHTYAYNEVDIEIDGEMVEPEDQPAFIDENNRTLVPLRFVGEELDTKVDWDRTEERITIDGDTELNVGENEYRVNGETKTMDTSPIIVNGRTVVPLRQVGELLDTGVEWDGKNVIVDQVDNKKEEDNENEEYNTIYDSDGIINYIVSNKDINNDKLPSEDKVKKVVNKIENNLDFELEEEIRVVLEENRRGEGNNPAEIIPTINEEIYLIYLYPTEDMDWNKENIEKILLHEIGHAIDFAVDLQNNYLEKRGIDDLSWTDNEKEKYSAWERSTKELVAEDFTVLFGYFDHENKTAFDSKTETEKGKIKEYIKEVIDY